MTSVTTESAELTSIEPVPPLLTISSRPTSAVTASTTAVRRVDSSAADAFFTIRTAKLVSGRPAICAS